MFLIFINTISLQISRQCPRVSPILYADDKALVPNIQHTEAYSFDKYMTELKKALKLLTAWCHESRMLFGEKKTELVIFEGAQESKPQHIALYSNMKLTNFTIRIVPSYTYLGLIMDRRLNWNRHMEHTLKKARVDSYKLTRIAIATPTPHPPAIRALCVGYLRPRCTYGFTFWAHELTSDEIRKYQSAFLQPMRRCLFLPSTTHQLGIFVEFNTPSFSAYRAKCQLAWYKRAASLPATHPTKQIFNIEMKIPAQTKPWNYLTPWKYAPPSRIARFDTYNEIKDKLIAFINTQQPNNPLTTFIQAHPKNPEQLTKQYITLIQMWITHLEWRTSITFGDIIYESDTIKTSRLRPKTTTSAERKEKFLEYHNKGKNDRKEDEVKEEKKDNENKEEEQQEEQKEDDEEQEEKKHNNNNNIVIPAAAPPAPPIPNIPHDDISILSKHHSTAPLKECKSIPSRSHFLYHVDDLHIATRARLRHNRVYTQSNRLKFPSNPEEKKILPYCTHPPCLASKLHEDIKHLLLDCPRYSTTRTTLIKDLSAKHYNDPLSIRLITDSIPIIPASSKAKQALYLHILQLTATFITSIIALRSIDKTLLPLTNS